jgi:hypothetical protein
MNEEMDIHRLAEKYRVRTKRDECGRFAAERRMPRRWRYIRRKMKGDGFQLPQEEEDRILAWLWEENPLYGYKYRLSDLIEVLWWRLYFLERAKSDDEGLWCAFDQAKCALANGDLETAGVLVADVTEEVARLETVTRATNARRYKHMLLDRAVMAAWAQQKRVSTRRAFVMRFIETHNAGGEREVFRILEKNLGKTSPHPWQFPKPQKV